MRIVKTEAGQQVIKDRSVPLTPRQRSVLILIDGKKTVEQVLAATGAPREEVVKLLEMGLVADLAPEQTAVENAALQVQAQKLEQHKQRTPQERYADAYLIATRLTSSLGLRGFRLNLAVEGTTSYEQLLAVAPRIREAVGPEKYAPLEDALNSR